MVHIWSQVPLLPRNLHLWCLPCMLVCSSRDLRPRQQCSSSWMHC